MKRMLIVALAFAVVFISIRSAAQDFYGIDKNSEKKSADIATKALSKSIEKMLNSRLSIVGSDIVISERRSFVVVSFLVAKPGIRGGGAHVVYDPKSDRVVYILGQD